MENNKMKNKISILKFSVLIAFILGSCTNLDEEIFGSLSPDNYYQTEEEALSSVAGVYQKVSDVVSIGAAWRPSVLGTDEFWVPARTNGGWYDGGIWIEYSTHNVSTSNVLNSRAWTSIFGMIGAANAVIQSLEESPNSDNLKGLIAETRGLRAFAYFYALDFWGNVPIFTDARVDPNNLPSTNTRSDVYDFVVTEMLAAAQDLPSVTEVSRKEYYPRFTKEAIYTALATVYLNAEVYSGTAHWNDVIDMCNNVISSNAYSLEDHVVNCFLSTNEENCLENISAFSIDPNKNAGSNQFILYTNHSLDKKKYNLSFGPADGYSTGDEAVNRYEDFDDRKTLIEYGPQYYLNGDPLTYDDGTHLVIIPIQNIRAAGNDEGYHVLKYSPIGTTWSGYNADNDFVLNRYSDILLMKAEALLRNNSAAQALPLVNEVRKRSNASTLASVSLNDIENERAREFIWEGTRRRDMIRFGSYFSDTWAFKTTVTPREKGLYPIPAEQITANPNLDQNPGYDN